MRQTAKALLIIAISLIFSFGCMPPKRTWTSHPEILTITHDLFEARITPLKAGYDFYVAFRLEVANTSGGNLQIDWNRTLYLFQGTTSGTFVFQDIDPMDMKNWTVPPDLIHPGQTLTKEIAPYKLLARPTLRERTKGAALAGFELGMLPSGENGIRLVVWEEREEIIENLTVLIQENKAK